MYLVDVHLRYLMLMRYWAKATASGFPDIVIVRSVLPPSRSSELLIRIMAPESCLEMRKRTLYSKVEIFFSNLPHIDKILSQSNSILIAGNSYCTISGSFAIIWFWYANHGSWNLSVNKLGKQQLRKGDTKWEKN